MTSWARRAALGLALISVMFACRREESADARARREIAEAEPVTDTGFAGPWFSARYLHDRTNAVLVGHVDRPAEAHRVKTSIRYPRWPVMSRDGRIVLLRDNPRAKRIEAIEVDTDKTVFARSLTGPDDITDAGWGPGRRFWYVERPPNQLDDGTLHVVDIDSQQDVVVASGHLKSPRWSPDGARIAYIVDGRIFSVEPRSGSVPAQLGDTQWAAGCLEWAPSGKQLAFCVWVAGENACQKVEILDPATGLGHRLVESNCISSLVWTPDERRVAYPWGTQIRAVPVAGGPMEILGGNDSFIRTFTIVGTTAYYFSVSSTFPATLWKQALGSTAATKAYESTHVPGNVSVAEELSVPAADRKLPVFRYPRTCGSAAAAGPAILWLPCNDNVPHDPRWQQEVQYFTRLGLAVYLIDIYEHPDHPAFADVETALAYVRSRPDTRAGEMFLFQCCGSSPLGERLLGGHGRDFVGVIDLQGVATRNVLDPARTPPMLWLTLTDDSSAASRDARLAVLRRTGVSVTERRFDTNHYYQDASARTGILEAIEAFVYEHTEPVCK